MSQTSSFTLLNDAGAAFRARLNEVVAALQTANAGASEPTDTAAGMLWLDTASTPPVLRQRNAADTGWEELLDGGEY